MTLLERELVVDAERNECAVRGCHERRTPDSLFCLTRGHLADQWAGRLQRRPDGSFVHEDLPKGRAA